MQCASLNLTHLNLGDRRAATEPLKAASRPCCTCNAAASRAAFACFLCGFISIAAAFCRKGFGGIRTRPHALDLARRRVVHFPSSDPHTLVMGQRSRSVFVAL